MHGEGCDGAARPPLHASRNCLFPRARLPRATGRLPRAPRRGAVSPLRWPLLVFTPGPVSNSNAPRLLTLPGPWCARFSARGPARRFDRPLRCSCSPCWPALATPLAPVSGLGRLMMLMPLHSTRIDYRCSVPSSKRHRCPAPPRALWRAALAGGKRPSVQHKGRGASEAALAASARGPAVTVHAAVAGGPLA
jgi:hypothetical protein